MRLAIRIIAIALVLVGFGVYIVWSVVDQSRLGSWAELLPPWLAWLLVICSFVYVCFDLLAAWPRRRTRAQDEKARNI